MVTAWKNLLTVASCLPHVILNERFLSWPQTVVNWIGDEQMPWFLQQKEEKHRFRRICRFVFDKTQLLEFNQTFAEVNDLKENCPAEILRFHDYGQELALS